MDPNIVRRGWWLEGGVPWAGDAELRLFDAPTEELADLAVDELIGAYAGRFVRPAP